MDDLISRAAALNAIDCWHIDFHTIDGAKVQTTCWRTIKELPAVDPAPVVRAEWIKETDRDNHFHCSACGVVWGVSAKAMKYCPGCGATMINCPLWDMDDERRDANA